MTNVQTRTTLIPSIHSTARGRFRYPSWICPVGKLGTPVTTVTSCPSSTQTRACSNVRAAGALVSGGKLSVRKRMRIPVTLRRLHLNFKAHAEERTRRSGGASPRSISMSLGFVIF